MLKTVEISLLIFKQINIVYCEKTNTHRKDILVKKLTRDTQVIPKIKLISRNINFEQITLHPQGLQ